MAEVEEIRFVMGGKSLRTSLGSRGVRMANCRVSCALHYAKTDPPA